MFSRIFATRHDWTGLFLRLTLGGVMWPHGTQKLLGWFGGYGFAGTMKFFTDTIHLPWLLGLLVIVIEFFGTLSLLVGWASRLWAAALAAVTLGIMFTSHLQNGFFMNWFGTQKGEGYEYFLLMLGLAAGVMVNGSGRYSVDELLHGAATEQRRASVAS